MPDDVAAAEATPETPLIADRKANKSAPANESLADGMRRLGGDDVFTGDAPVIVEKEAESEPAKKEPKAKKEPEATAPADVESLKEAAKKLGYTIEDGVLTTPERYKARKKIEEERTASFRAIKAAEEKAMAAIAAREEEVAPKAAKYDAFIAAAEAGDADGMAKAAGRKDWNEMQEELIARHQDPNYKRIKELERRLASEDEAKAKAAEEAQRHHATQAELRAQAEYKQGLAGSMKVSPDPLVKNMSAMPNFVAAVFNVQKQNYQGSGETITPERALDWRPPNGGATLREEMKVLYDALSPVFAKSAPVEAPAGTPAKPKPKTPTVPTTAPSRPDIGTDREWKQRAAAKIQEAQREELRNGSTRGY